MIVIDTNILAYGILAEADSAKRAQAEMLFSREQVLIPVLWRHEFLNMLASYAKAGMMTPPVAEGANTVLVTEDQKLRKAAGPLALSLKEYLAR